MVPCPENKVSVRSTSLCFKPDRVESHLNFEGDFMDMETYSSNFISNYLTSAALHNPAG